MELLNSIASWVFKKRFHQIELFKKYPIDVQTEWFYKLLDTAKYTEWGGRYDYRSIKTIDDYRSRVPVQTYEGFKNDIIRLKHGAQNVLWPTDIRWFAKSSGTTSDKSKFIPVSREALEECHYKGGKDLLSIYYNHHPDSKVLSGKGLALGGSREINRFNSDSYYGDLSSIIIKNLPVWAEFARTPQMSIALMPEWESKIEKMAEVTSRQNVTSISGVPSWTLILLQRVMELNKTDDLSTIWPNLELYVHGGVSFEPYRDQYSQIISSPGMSYMETYNASEGFFGIQDEPDSDSLLLMLDYGIFYEFMPMDELGKEFPKTCTLDEVELGENYALIISTNAGLWRYLVGDTVCFTSLNPFRIKITGRTTHYINAFGEELIVENAEKALAIACRKTEASVKEYTAGPIFMERAKQGAHEWLIEFEKHPQNLNYFTEVFDTALKSLNSDYEAKRYRDMALSAPVIEAVPSGTFYNWLRAKGKLGGQNKVPRLSNNRKYLDSVKETMAQSFQEKSGQAS